MLTIILLVAIFIFTYMGLPQWVRLVVFIANMFVPDPIPYVDEIIMFALLFKSNKKSVSD